jgi:L-alanine-DL-glutamate epimerase-like enolase superfamily enzyme
MIVERIHINLIRLPFRVAYGHKRKTHNEVYSIICRIEDGESHSGLGEAVPRIYVTGETAQSAFQDMETLGRRLVGKRFSSFSDIQEWVIKLSADWPAPFPSCAFASIDLALHDCLAASNGQDMGAYLGGAAVPVGYTASIGLTNKAKLLALLSVYRLSGIRSFKLKVGDEHDVSRLRTIKSFMGKDAPVFVDANGAWSKAEAPRKIEALAELGAWAIEEPLHIPMPTGASDENFQIDRDACMQDAHFESYANLRQKISIPVILDESLISPKSYERIIKHDAANILNIRLSKLGGYSLASKMVQDKSDAVKFGIGAMVGESPILAAAGYFFGCAHPGHLYIQGYSHRILHGSTFTLGGPLMKRGKVSSKEKGPGMGLTLDPNALEGLTLSKKTLKHEKE